MTTVTIQTLATAQAKADAAFEGTSLKTAQGIARLMGDNPSLEIWEANRKAYVLAYQEAAKCGDNAADKAWSRMAAKMDSEFGLTKPKAKTAEAARKAKARAVPADLAAKVESMQGSTAEKLAQCAAMPKAEATKAAALILKAEADAAKEANKAADSKRKELAKALAKRLGDADYETLLAVEKVLDKAAKA